MIKNAIEQIKEVDKLSKNTINIPITYTIFIIECFFLWKPEFLSLLKIADIIPKNVQLFLLEISYLIYNNIIFIIAFLIILIVIINSLWLKTRLSIYINKIYEENDEVSWNFYSGIRRLLDLIVKLFTSCFIYYLLINILFNNKEITLILSTPIWYLENLDLYYFNSEIILLVYILFIVNIIYTIFLIIKSLFELKSDLDKWKIDGDEIFLYIVIDSFEFTNSSGEKLKIVILKDKYRKESLFYLAEVQLSKRIFIPEKENYFNDRVIESHFSIEEISINEQMYKIIDSSKKLSEIIYTFDFYKQIK